MKKAFVLGGILLSTCLLAGCGQQSDEKKSDFLITTKTVGDFGREVSITKPGRIAGTEEITVTSQVSGRIGSLIKKDGQTVSGGQPVLGIQDVVANYALQVERAKNALDRAVLQYQQTKIAVDKGINDAGTALEAAENTYSVSQATVEQSLKKAKIDYQGSAVSRENLGLQFVSERTNLMNLMSSSLHQVDTYLGVTDMYKLNNDTYEIYLGAKDSAQKITTEKLIYSLYSFRNQISVLSGGNLAPDVEVLAQGYDMTKQLLESMKTVLLNTIASTTLSQSMIDGYRSAIEGLSNSLQLSNSAFLAYRKQVRSTLLADGTGTIESTQELADVSYDTTVITTQNALFNSEVAVRNAKSAYDNLLKTKDLQVGLVENSVSDASVGYQDALSKYNKLGVRSPIAGVIGTVLVDVGQEVNAGTPLFTVVSSQNQMLEVYVTAEESKSILLDQFAQVVYAGQQLTGKVVSISSVADKNTMYKVIVSLDKAVDLLGDVATVSFPVLVSTPILPLNVITPVSANKGYIWTMKGTGLVKMDVDMGHVWNDLVQVDSSLPDGVEVITSDISNYDAEKFVLKRE